MKTITKLRYKDIVFEMKVSDSNVSKFFVNGREVAFWSLNKHDGKHFILEIIEL